MAISKQLIEKMNGSIKVFSEKGKGTTGIFFYIIYLFFFFLVIVTLPLLQNNHLNISFTEKLKLWIQRCLQKKKENCTKKIEKKYYKNSKLLYKNNEKKNLHSLIVDDNKIVNY